ncbi:hypothetical protein MW887_010282 [Aspergillus wentii]|nr:hypothetical protein MW887_010282 [Aspergillus wentii]
MCLGETKWVIYMAAIVIASFPYPIVFGTLIFSSIDDRAADTIVEVVVKVVDIVKDDRVLAIGIKAFVTVRICLMVDHEMTLEKICPPEALLR